MKNFPTPSSMSKNNTDLRFIFSSDLWQRENSFVGICWSQNFVSFKFCSITKQSPSLIFYFLWHRRHSVWDCSFNFVPVGGSSEENPHSHLGSLILYNHGGWGVPQQQSLCATSTNWSKLRICQHIDPLIRKFFKLSHLFTWAAPEISRFTVCVVFPGHSHVSMTFTLSGDHITDELRGSMLVTITGWNTNKCQTAPSLMLSQSTLEH